MVLSDEILSICTSTVKHGLITICSKYLKTLICEALLPSRWGKMGVAIARSGLHHRCHFLATNLELYDICLQSRTSSHTFWITIYTIIRNKLDSVRPLFSQLNLQSQQLDRKAALQFMRVCSDFLLAKHTFKASFCHHPLSNCNELDR